MVDDARCDSLHQEFEKALENVYGDDVNMEEFMLVSSTMACHVLQSLEDKAAAALLLKRMIGFLLTQNTELLPFMEGVEVNPMQ